MTTTWSEDPIFGQVKRAMLASGGLNGIRDAVKKFRVMDANSDGHLSPEELRTGLKQYGVDLSKQQTDYLVRAFDRDRDGRVSINEFINELVSSVPKRRVAVVKRLYGVLQERHGQEPRSSQVLQDFDLSKHPAVEKGLATQADLQSQFDAAFKLDADGDGIVSQEEWMAFCAGLSFTMPNDDVFETFLLRSLDADDPNAPRLYETQLKRGTLSKPYDVDVDATKEPFGAATAKKYDTTQLFREKYNRPDEPLPSVKSDYVTTMKRSFPHPTQEQTAASLPKKDVFSATGDPVLDGVRKKILKRVGEDGFVGLQRSFRIMDKSRDQKIDKEEFTNGMKRLRIELTPAEVSSVMKKCDRSGDGFISVGELARTVRGPIRSQQRIDILLEAFQRLDKSNDGIISLAELVPRYDTSRHKDVLAGKKTSEEVVQQFVADWDGNRDGRITAAEWMDYYANISCTIDHDDYFELMIRNAWHISGGSGWAANTSCRRVLAKFTDGRERVVEIKDDIGLRKDDIQGMIDRLRSQGHEGIISIKLHF